MSYKLKLKGDVALPGLALPEAFQSLDTHLESVMQLCTAKGSPEAQLIGMITICEDLKQLLKCAFIENGMLASRIEILTRYQMESVKKMDKKVNDMDIENRITHKHMKRLRKKLNAQLVIQKKKDSEWWDMTVRTTDYDSFITLSRAGGYPDLEFMLRVNQLMIDFVRDSGQTELVLPPMGLEERQEVSKLASIYKLRCRYGKSVQIAPSTLLKARQACIPAAGEVDAILNNFARTHIQRKVTDVISDDTNGGANNKAGEAASSSNKTEKPTSIPLPSSMLTPLPNIPSPTIDIISLRHSSPHSPPNSAPTESHAAATRFLRQQQLQRGDGSASSTSAAGHEGTSARRTSTNSSVSSLSGVPADGKNSVATQSSSSSTSGTPSSSSSGILSRLDSSHSRAQDGKKVGKGKELNTPHTSTGSRSSSSTSSVTSASPAVTRPPPLPKPSTTPTRVSPTTPSSSPHHHHHHPPLSSVGIVLTSSAASVGGGTRSPGGGVLVQSPIRSASGSTQHTPVLALPIKCQPPSNPPQTPPLQVSSESQLLQSRNQRKDKEREGVTKKRGTVGEKGKVGGGGEEGETEGNGCGTVEGSRGGGSARTDSMGPPIKRVRVTRRSAAEEEHAKQ